MFKRGQKLAGFVHRAENLKENNKNLYRGKTHHFLSIGVSQIVQLSRPSAESDSSDLRFHKTIEFLILFCTFRVEFACRIHVLNLFDAHINMQCWKMVRFGTENSGLQAFPASLAIFGPPLKQILLYGPIFVLDPFLSLGSYSDVLQNL